MSSSVFNMCYLFIWLVALALWNSLVSQKVNNILAWKIPWMEEPGGLQSIGPQRVRHHQVTTLIFWTSLVAQMVKCLPIMQETRVPSLGREDPLEKEMQPTPVFLSGEFHGPRNLVGYSPLGRKELDTAERLHSLALQLWHMRSSIFVMMWVILSCSIWTLSCGMQILSCGMQILGCGILVSWPEMEPGLPPLGSWSLSHWTTREVPELCC